MRNQALGLSALFVLSLVVTACGGSSADIKKVGLVTDVGTLEDKSFNEASWLGAQAGATAIGGKAEQHRHQGPGRLRGEHQDVRRPGLRRHRHRRLRHGRRDDRGGQAVSECQVHRRGPGRLRRRDGQDRPDLRLQGRSEDPPAELPGPDRSRRTRPATSPASLAGSVSKSGVIGTVGGINTIPAVVRYINGYRNGAASVGIKPENVKVGRTSRPTSPRPSTTRAPASRSASR